MYSVLFLCKWRTLNDSDQITEKISAHIRYLHAGEVGCVTLISQKLSKYLKHS